jgi:predicted nucleotidyltransferase
MPILGMIIPNMGARSRFERLHGLADTLFSATQQRVLGPLFLQPDRSFYASELIAAARGGSGAVQRELARLEGAGLITTTRIGNQKHYQANRESPIFDELRGIVLKTFGVADVLRAALQPLAAKIHAAFVYGSVAKGSDTSASDIDLMIVGEGLSYPEVIEALSAAETQLGRPVSPTIYSQKELDRKLAAGNAFLQRVLEQPHIVLIGDERVATESR